MFPNFFNKQRITRRTDNKRKMKTIMWPLTACPFRRKFHCCTTKTQQLSSTRAAVNTKFIACLFAAKKGVERQLNEEV